MQGPTRRLLPVAAAAILLALTSCASLQHGWDRGNVRMVADLINRGQASKLASLSGSPFLIDGEVVPLKADVAGFWSGIIKAGYKVQDPELGSAAPVGADSYKRFADTMEVRAFFKNYVQKGTRMLELKTAAGKSILLIVKDTPFSKKIIQGFKGPY
jgi:hypothetical protein